MVYYQNGNSNVVNPLYMSRLAAPNLEWEKTKAWNVGLDLSFFNGRLTANMDYYFKKTTDMIMSQRLPSFSGFGSIMANLGEVQNQGFEIALNSTNIQNKDFTWNTSVGFSINKNKINHIYYDYDENGVERMIHLMDGLLDSLSVPSGILKQMVYGRILRKTLRLLHW